MSECERVAAEDAVLDSGRRMVRIASSAGRRAVASAFRPVGALNIHAIGHDWRARPSAKLAGRGHQNPGSTMRHLSTGDCVCPTRILRCGWFNDCLAFATADVLSIDLLPWSGFEKHLQLQAFNTPVLALALRSSRHLAI